MKKLILLFFTLSPLFAHCEKHRYVTSTATVWYVSYSDGTSRTISYWTTGSRIRSTSEKEDDEYLIEVIKEDYESIFRIAPKSTKIDSVYVNYNEVECRYDGFDAFHTRSNARLSRVYDVDSNCNVTLRREH